MYAWVLPILIVHLQKEGASRKNKSKVMLKMPTARHLSARTRQDLAEKGTPARIDTQREGGVGQSEDLGLDGPKELNWKT